MKKPVVLRNLPVSPGGPGSVVFRVSRWPPPTINFAVTHTVIIPGPTSPFLHSGATLTLRHSAKFDYRHDNAIAQKWLVVLANLWELVKVSRLRVAKTAKLMRFPYSGIRPCLFRIQQTPIIPYPDVTPDTIPFSFTNFPSPNNTDLPPGARRAYVIHNTLSPFMLINTHDWFLNPG